MTPTKDQQAQEYAEKKLKAFSKGTANDYDKIADYFDFFDVKDAFEDGYTACEQSVWRSVEEAMTDYMRNYETDMRHDDIDAIIEILKEKSK